MTERIDIKCIRSDCHKRLRQNVSEWTAYQNEARKMNAAAGLLCPRHAIEAFEDEQKFAVDVPLGEVVAETLSDHPRWRLVWTPEGATSI